VGSTISALPLRRRPGSSLHPFLGQTRALLSPAGSTLPPLETLPTPQGRLEGRGFDSGGRLFFAHDELDRSHSPIPSFPPFPPPASRPLSGSVRAGIWGASAQPYIKQTSYLFGNGAFPPHFAVPPSFPVSNRRGLTCRVVLLRQPLRSVRIANYLSWFANQKTTRHAHTPVLMSWILENKNRNRCAFSSFRTNLDLRSTLVLTTTNDVAAAERGAIGNATAHNRVPSSGLRLLFTRLSSLVSS